MPIFAATEVLGAMITPALLISASGTLVLSTSNRLTRVVDRVRTLAEQASRLGAGIPGGEAQDREPIEDQLSRLSRRALVLRSALTSLYNAIGFLVATSISIALSALLHWRYSGVPVILGLAGACCLFFGSIQLVREARLAVGSTLQEMELLRRAVRGSEAR